MRFSLLLLAALCAYACAESDGTKPECKINSDCPRAHVCVDGQCVVSDAGVIAKDSGVTDASASKDSEIIEEDAEVIDATIVVDAEIDAAVLDAEILDASVVDAAISLECTPGTRRNCSTAVGQCKIGYNLCDETGHWGENCIGGVFPKDEICNNADDDCNGIVDDGFHVGEPCDGMGECGMGVIECKNATETRCSTELGGTAEQVRAEICDGRDNDCDGETDEGFDIGMPCTGRCGGGFYECHPTNGSVICDTDMGGSHGTATQEICDGRDNDCDGETDEDFNLGARCTSLGVCGVGQYECDENGGRRCSSAPGGSQSRATEEICDGLDNDCDGETDEGFDMLGTLCTGKGECGTGVWECTDSSGLRCSTDLGGSAYGGTAEICDGLDNDCDGETDEGLGLGTTCAGVGVCSAGVWECGSNGQRLCSTSPGGTAYHGTIEICDGLDNDCDGETDEGFAVGQPCDGLGVCGSGVWECAEDGSRICSTSQGGSAYENENYGPELCDGLDNDCDGEIDEDGACGGDVCTAAPDLTDVGFALGDTRGLTNSISSSSQVSEAYGRDQIFRFVPDGDAWTIALASLEPSFDPLMWVSNSVNGCDGLNTSVGKDVSSSRVKVISLPSVVQGRTYRIVVDEFELGEGGPFVITANPKSRGDECNSAISLPIPGAFAGTLVGRTSGTATLSCVSGLEILSADQIFKVSLNEATNVRITVTPNSSNDVAIYATSICASVDANCLGGQNEVGAGQSEVLEIELPAGDSYLVVESVGTEGPFLLQIETN